MASRILILGGGTGGTLTANRLRRLYTPAEAEIVVVDQDDDHVYQPGLLFVPFGLADPRHIVRPREHQLRAGIGYHQSPIEVVDLDADEVRLADGSTLPYDVLVVATGAVLVPEETDGLTGAGWMERAFTFYDLPGASALAGALDRFEGGRLVVNVIDMPIKCPVAPLEFCFLADWYFSERGIRDKVTLTYVTPLDGAFTKPVASRQLAALLADKRVELVSEFNTGRVDGDALHEPQDGATRHPFHPRVHRDDRRHRRGLVRLQGIRRPVRAREERLHRTGTRHHHRRRVLRKGRRRADHLHLMARPRHPRRTITPRHDSKSWPWWPPP